MRFIVRREFRWEGRLYKPGEKLELEERHPRLAGMVQGRFITYDNSVSNAPPNDQSSDTNSSRRPAVAR